jgi:hypothetical protein
VAITDATGTTAGAGRPRSPFAATARFRRPDAALMLDALAGITRGAPPPAPGTRAALDRLERLAEVALGRAGAGPGEVTEIGAGEGLDLAAELLECADELAGSGCSVAALCLEGIEGRLLEALLDAGPLPADSGQAQGR